MTKQTLTVQGIDINYNNINDKDYISLTDVARYKSDDPNDVIRNWLRSKSTVEFLGLWETLNNPNFKPVEFDGFRQEAGSNHFTLSPQKWITTTNAIGIVSKSGKYGGTYAHKDIALEFASWIAPEFRLYLIIEIQKAKEKELENKNWNVKREIAKINYRIHTDALKEIMTENNYPIHIMKQVYSSEADMLNVIVFGKRALNWKKENPNKRGNIRDYASAIELIVLANLENYNAELVSKSTPIRERIRLLCEMRDRNLKSLENYENNKLLK